MASAATSVVIDTKPKKSRKTLLRADRSIALCRMVLWTHPKMCEHVDQKSSWYSTEVSGLHLAFGSALISGAYIMQVGAHFESLAARVVLLFCFISARGVATLINF